MCVCALHVLRVHTSILLVQTNVQIKTLHIQTCMDAVEERVYAYVRSGAARTHTFPQADRFTLARIDGLHCMQS